MENDKDPFWWYVGGLIVLVVGLVALFKSREMESVPVGAYQELKKETAVTAGSSKSTPANSLETVPPGEEAQIDEITAMTFKLLQQRYPGSMARRNVHPKDHGCVRADFTISQDIPEKFRVGVFSKPGRAYKAWIRYSNATPRVEPDVDANRKASSRGMAIKLLNIEGKTLLDEPGAKTQDFLMINQPVFTFANVADYLELTRVQLASKNDNVAAFFAQPTPSKLKTLGIIQGIREDTVGNPLEARYFSAAPYLFGHEMAVKFSVKPRIPAATPLPENPSPTYLREAMRRSLAPGSGQPVTLDFMVQERVRTDLPIEDATAVWSEDAAPFATVAAVTIGLQDFDNPLVSTECEHMVFTPWHGLAEHQPLGGINRLRKAVYIASSQFRLQAREPTGYPD